MPVKMAVRAVPHHHVAGLMSNHPGELRLIFGGLKHSAVHIDVPARQSERIDLRAVDDPELPHILRMVVGRKSHQPFPQAVEVVQGLRVVQQGQLLVHLRSVFLPHLHVLLGGVEVVTGLEVGLAYSPDKDRQRQHRKE
jgi:hypothetical protein